jgi:hypothetical protein
MSLALSWSVTFALDVNQCSDHTVYFGEQDPSQERPCGPLTTNQVLAIYSARSFRPALIGLDTPLLGSCSPEYTVCGNNNDVLLSRPTERAPEGKVRAYPALDPKPEFMRQLIYHYSILQISDR